MQLLFMACKGDVAGVKDLLDEGIDVNSIDLDGRTALHIAACEGHVEVAKLLLSRKANIDARDRWGSTVDSLSFLLVVFIFYLFIGLCIWFDELLSCKFLDILLQKMDKYREMLICLYEEVDY